MSERTYNAPYTGDRLSRVAFPMGGFGAGMICLEGTGALSHVSFRHKPEVFNEPLMFGALYVKDAPAARVLEGPVPMWKASGPASSGGGGYRKSYGLPHFAEATFLGRFPFGTVELRDESMPLEVEITGWSPFTPGNADDSSLPVCALEYRFRNTSASPVEAVFSYHAANLMATGKESGAYVAQTASGFLLLQPPKEKPADEGVFAVIIPDEGVQVDCAWFRGGWFDALTILWKHVAAGDAVNQPPHTGDPGNGGSIYLPFTLAPGEECTIPVLFAWYVPKCELRAGADPEEPKCEGSCCGEGEVKENYIPWYAGRFGSIDEVAGYWRGNYARLRAESQAFTDCFYDTTLPPEVIEAAAANLSILKSPT